MLSPIDPNFTFIVFLAGAFAGALVTGLAGFAFGLVAAAIWLHVLPPGQTTPLIAAYALLVQGYAVWKLRGNLDAARLAPLVIGSALGVPAGVALLTWVPPAYLRVAVGALLVLFSLYSLLRPTLPRVRDAGRAGDAAVGFLNGAIGGATGLAGILVVIWSGLRGWPRDEQRAVFQPTGVATFLVTILALSSAGIVTPDTVRLFLVGLPAIVVGTWLGWTLYGRLDEASFRKIVLVLLLVSGAGLVATVLGSAAR